MWNKIISNVRFDDLGRSMSRRTSLDGILHHIRVSMCLKPSHILSGLPIPLDRLYIESCDTRFQEICQQKRTAFTSLSQTIA